MNFRSRGEVLDAVDLTFDSHLGRELRAAARGARRARGAAPCGSLRGAAGDRPPQEALGRSTSRARSFPSVRPCARSRRGGRPKRGCWPGGWTSSPHGGRPYALSDVVVLLRATTHIAVYERALEERGIPTFVLGGRGYWSQQQVGDLRAYLAALANPRDELALHSVLASPLGGLSLDSLVILRAAARRARLGGLALLEAMAGDAAEDAPEPLAATLDGAPGEDADRLRAFVRRFASRACGGAPDLARDPDRPRRHRIRLRPRRALDARGRPPDGERAQADADGARVRGRGGPRPARLHRLRGRARPDLRSARDRRRSRPRTWTPCGSMTIHRAKGLEFPVVCLADLGKGGREDNSALQITDDGRVGVRLASLGGGVDEQRGARADPRAAEARGRGGGAADLLRRGDPRPGAPGAQRRHRPREAASRCAARGAHALGVARPGAGPRRTGRAGRVGNRLGGPPRPGAVRGAAARRLPTSCWHPRTAIRLGPSRIRPGSRLSPPPCWRRCRCPRPCPSAGSATRASSATRAAATASTSSGRCGCRRPRGRAPSGGNGRSDSLSALVRGSIVHELLERLDFADPLVPPPDAVADADPVEGRAGTRARGRGPAGHGRAVRRDADASTDRSAPARVRTELPFAFTLATAGGRACS